MARFDNEEEEKEKRQIQTTQDGVPRKAEIPHHIEISYLFFINAFKTRPDTRPPVSDRWAGADMRVFPLFDWC